MDRPGSPAGSGNFSALAAFLAMAFLVVGLVGLFATYAVPLPLQRALARDAALDAAQAAAHAPDASAALEALRPRLAESAEAILPPGGDMDARIAAARAAMRAQLAGEADEVATRTRWMVCVITLMGAVFGVALLRMVRRG